MRAILKLLHTFKFHLNKNDYIVDCNAIENGYVWYFLGRLSKSNYE